MSEALCTPCKGYRECHPNGPDLIRFEYPPPGCCVMVTNLSLQTTCSELHQTFQSVGFVLEARLYPPPASSKASVGYGIVRFCAPSCARMAVHHLDGTVINEYPCKVYVMKPVSRLFKRQLPFEKCTTLLNHYLGFNGWSTSIQDLELCDQKILPSSREYLCEFTCMAELRFNHMNNTLVTDDGWQGWKESFARNSQSATTNYAQELTKCSEDRNEMGQVDTTEGPLNQEMLEPHQPLATKDEPRSNEPQSNLWFDKPLGESTDRFLSPQQPVKQISPVNENPSSEESDSDSSSGDSQDSCGHSRKVQVENCNFSRHQLALGGCVVRGFGRGWGRDTNKRLALDLGRKVISFRNILA